MVGLPPGRLPGGEEDDQREKEGACPDQGETTARLFQNRTVGSGRGQPDLAR